MYQVTGAHEAMSPAAQSSTSGKNGLDLLVLRYMARRLHLQMRWLDQSARGPMRYTLSERRNRFHRLVIYRQHELLHYERLTFVGFISKQHEQAKQEVREAVMETDRQLVLEMADNPGILSYASLELSSGHWYNLVLFGRADYRTPLKNSAAHSLAAYTLAPQYYEWIRLHKGVMPQGLDYSNMVLQHTSYYTFG